MKQYDVVVIGAATSGSFFARKMAEKGYKVKVIEKNTFEKVGTKYDIFHISEKEFERFSLPRPHENDKAWAFEFSGGYTCSPTGKYPKRTDEAVVGLHMHEYTVLMNKWAQEAGAEIEYGAKFEDLILDDGKIVGIEYEGKDGDQKLYAKTVVDCSGIDAKARRKLPESSTVENFKLQEDDMFYVILRYIKFKDQNIYLADSSNWPFYKSWIAPQPDRNGGIFGIGACHSYDYAESMFEKVEKNIVLPDHDVIRVEKGKTPYTRPPYSFVDDNFIVSGDAGCLTKPNNGEGVTSSMVQIVIAADVLDEALKANDTSKEKLWKLNLLYNQQQGADFASTRAILTKAVNAKQSEFEYFFKHDIIFSEKFLGGQADGPEVKISLKDVLQIGTGAVAGIATGKLSFSSLKLLLEGIALGGQLKEHYLKFPETPEGYKEWKEKADEIWATVGKMS